MKTNELEARVDLQSPSRRQDLPRKSQPDSSRQLRVRKIRQDMREGWQVTWDDIMWMLEELEAL